MESFITTIRKRSYNRHGNRCQGDDVPFVRSNSIHQAHFSQDVTSPEVGGVTCHSKLADKASQTDDTQTSSPSDDQKISSSSCDVTSCDGPKKLHFSNLPFRFRESHLRSLLTQFGDILNIEIIFNGRGSKGFGFATFARHSEAENARLRLNGVIIEGRKIEVNEATKNYLKKRNSSFKRNHNHHHRSYLLASPEVIGERYDGGQAVHSSNQPTNQMPELEQQQKQQHHHHQQQQSFNQHQLPALKNDLLISMENPFPPKLLTPIQLSPLIFTTGVPVEKPMMIHSSENVLLPLRLPHQQSQIYPNNLLSIGVPSNAYVFGGFSSHPVSGIHHPRSS